MPCMHWDGWMVWEGEQTLGIGRKMIKTTIAQQCMGGRSVGSQNVKVVRSQIVKNR